MVERLEFFRTTKLRCQIFAILLPKMFNRQIGIFGFEAFGESVTCILPIRFRTLINPLVTVTC